MRAARCSTLCTRSTRPRPRSSTRASCGLALLLLLAAAATQQVNFYLRGAAAAAAADGAARLSFSRALTKQAMPTPHKHTHPENQQTARRCWPPPTTATC